MLLQAADVTLHLAAMQPQVADAMPRLAATLPLAADVTHAAILAATHAKSVVDCSRSCSPVKRAAARHAVTLAASQPADANQLVALHADATKRLNQDRVLIPKYRG